MGKYIIYLVGCGKQKQSHKAWRGPAKELYTGSLFKNRKAFAEKVNVTWYIVSALYGLVQPDEQLKPYDQTINGLMPMDRAIWALDTCKALIETLATESKPDDFQIHLHMGADYAKPLSRLLGMLGFEVVLPVEGLGQGEQMKWYSQERNSRGGLVALDRCN